MTADAANEPAVILFAHGSRAAEANDWHVAMCRALAERTGRRVEPAFLELCTPDLVTAAGTLAGEGHRTIVVVPYLLAPGRHAREDLPRLVVEANATIDGVEVVLQPIFGEDPAILDLLAAQLDR